MAEIIQKQGLNRQGTICILNPPQELRAWDFEENHQKLCEAISGERANRIYWDEKEKLVFFDFKGPERDGIGGVQNGKKGKGKGKGKKAAEEEEDEDEWPEDAVILDVAPQVHRFHQFGAGRWKFSVENFVSWDEDDEDEYVGRPLEILKPLQPFLITWEVMQHAGQEGQSWKKSNKKPTSVKAMPDWRNPLGFACNCAKTQPPQELLGVCASVQGLESGGSAFVAGATILGMNYLPLILTTLDPAKWQIYWGYDAQTYEICAIKITQYEIILPPETITEDVLWKINQFREKVLEALTPWEDDDAQTKRRGGPSLYVSDISSEMAELLQCVWPHPEPVVRPKKIIWSSAIGEEYSSILHPYHPFAEEFDWDSADYGQQEKSSKKAKAPKVETKKGVNKQQAKSVGEVVAYLGTQPGGQALLSKLAGHFKVKKNLLESYPELLRCTAVKGYNDHTVSLAGGNKNGVSKAGGKAQSKGKGKQKGGAADSGSNSKAKASGKGGPNIDSRIDQLLAAPEMPCVVADFDNRVKGWLRGFESRRGRVKTESAFKMLKEWVTQKERDQVRSWPSYLMVLLRNWERDTFEEGKDS